ncbi:MAG: hypothetical protein Q8J99_00670 [Sulfuritalea sp.]|nr:hypothetical protein [Sulfuritalea sp.]
MSKETLTQGIQEISQLCMSLDKVKRTEIIFFCLSASGISIAAAYYAGALAFFVCASIFWSGYFVLFRLWAFGIENMRTGMLSITYASEIVRKNSE